MRRALAVLAVVAGFLASHRWRRQSAARIPGQPGEATYDVVTTTDIPVTMPDGRVLRAAIHAPAVKGTKTPAEGPFPVILVQTPYGKSVGDIGLGTVDDELVKRGYLGVIVDVAGTGGSEGQSQLFGTQEAEDGAELVRWAADLPNSTGTVGPGRRLVPRDRPGVHRRRGGPELAAQGHLPDRDGVRPLPRPVRGRRHRQHGVEPGPDRRLLRAAHAHPGRRARPEGPAGRDPARHPARFAGIPFELTTGLDVLFQRGRAYDSAYWQERAPQRVLQKVVDNDVAVYLVGGQYDVFQRGEPLLYSGLQNAAAGRSVVGADGAGPGGRPALPAAHRARGTTATRARAPTCCAASSQWFDHWLKGVDTGVLDTTTPLHVIEPGGATLRHRAVPVGAGVLPALLPPARQEARHRGAGGGHQPVSDSIIWKPLSLYCQRSLNQWGAGIFRDIYEACKKYPPLSQAAAR